MRTLNNNRVAFAINYSNDDARGFSKRLFIYTIDPNTGNLGGYTALVFEATNSSGASQILDGYPKCILFTTSDKKYIICRFALLRYYRDTDIYCFDENGNAYTAVNNQIISTINNNNPEWGNLQRIADNTYLAFNIRGSGLEVFTFNESNKNYTSKIITSSIPSSMGTWFFIKKDNNDLYYFVAENVYRFIRIHITNSDNMTVINLGQNFNRVHNGSFPMGKNTFNEYNIRQVFEDVNNDLISWVYYGSLNPATAVYNERLSIYERWLDETYIVNKKTTSGSLFGITKTNCKKFKKGKIVIPL